MKKEIFLVGSGLTRFGERWDKGLKDISNEAARSAIQSSGIIAEDGEAKDCHHEAPDDNEQTDDHPSTTLANDIPTVIWQAAFT